jgi:hypothetical protein
MRRGILLMTVLVAGMMPGLATAAAPMRFLVQMRYQERIEWYRHFEWSLAQQTVVCSWTRDAKGFDQAKYRFARPVPVTFTRYGRVVAMNTSPSFHAQADVNLWREASGEMPAESSRCYPPPVPVPTSDCGIKLFEHFDAPELSYNGSQLTVQGQRPQSPDPFARCDYEGVVLPTSYTITGRLTPRRLAGLRIGSHIELSDHDSDASNPSGQDPNNFARWTEKWSSSLIVTRVSPAAWRRAGRPVRPAAPAR